MKKDSGITLISLGITIVVMLILVGVVTVTGVNYIKSLNTNKLSTELYQVQHAVLEQYTMYKETKNERYIKGTPISKSQVMNIMNNSSISLGDTEENYYRLTPTDLAEIGIHQSEDDYIVNYITGEVINATTTTDSMGKTLYIQGK